MQFSALPVNTGDAFLVKSSQGTILVDGGKNKKQIVQLLKKENLKHINLLVCTHYDADHINGLIGILESNAFTFDEIWLPETLGSLAYTLSEDLFSILCKLRELSLENIEDIFKSAGHFKDEFSKTTDDTPIKIANLETTKMILTSLPSSLIFNIELHALMLPFFKIAKQLYSMFINMGSAIAIVLSALSSGAYVRWFRYCPKLTNNTSFLGMHALNSQETGVTCFSPEIFLKMLYLTTINKGSLVCKFDIPDFPNVLFCADSDLAFATSLPLNDSSIVTAPHHGAESCSNAYSIIQGNDLIYVRSDNSQRVRPGTTYLKQQTRYCTICRNKGPKQKVEINYSGSSRTILAKRCNC
jgi:hypothetical protein